MSEGKKYDYTHGDMVFISVLGFIAGGILTGLITASVFGKDDSEYKEKYLQKVESLYIQSLGELSSESTFGSCREEKIKAQTDLFRAIKWNI